MEHGFGQMSLMSSVAAPDWPVPREPWRKDVRHAMGAMAQKSDHGKKMPWKNAMASIANKNYKQPEWNLFRAARSSMMMNHHESSQ